jgi:Zn-dependent metalloprotease
MTAIRINRNISQVLTLALFILASMTGFTQVKPTKELKFNNSNQLFYIEPDESWAETATSELPDILSEIYGVSKGWTLTKVAEEEDQFGRYVKFFQTYLDYTVEGGDIIINYDKDGAIRNIIGTARDIDMSSPVFNTTSEQAVKIVLADLKTTSLNYDVDPETGEVYEPVIIPRYAPNDGDQSSKYLLCYEIEILLRKPSRNFYYINVNDGSIEKKTSAIMHSNATGTSVYSGTVSFKTTKRGNIYLTHDSIKKIKAYDYGYNRCVMDYTVCGHAAATRYFFSDGDNNWTSIFDRQAVDVMWGCEKTYDYFLSKHGRKSYDGNGAYIKNRCYYDPVSWSDKRCPIDSITECDSNYNNAFWNGKNLTYGQGDGVNAGIYGSINTVGHEFTHAVVEKTAGLKYEAESGALNESFADMFGTSIEFFAKESIGKTGNYKYGEEHTTPGNDTDCLRDLEDPKSEGQPDTYKGDHWVNTANTSSNNDYGGVHYNSGVGNHWYYLLCKGGKDKNDKDDEYDVTAIGRAKADKIAYRALSRYMSTYSDYEQARKATLLAAEDLYGEESTEYKQVCEAWFAVNVGEKCCDTMKLEFTITNPKCHDSKDGEIKLEVKKGSGKYEFKWFKGDTTSMVLATSKNISGLDSGNYIVIVKDTAFKCEEVGDTTLEAPEEVKVSISGGGTYKARACDRTFDITLTASASGGTSPYTYSWMNRRKVIRAGGRNGFSRTYTAEAADKNNCKGKKDVLVTYIPITCSYDPNDIIGPPAYSDTNFVSINATLPYKIRYENDPKFATGPAQKVVIYHDLDSNTDWNSFRLGDFGFYNYNFEVPENSTVYTNRLDIRDSFDIYLDVTAGLDVSIGQAFWIFESIDPNTGLPPTSGDKGFLAVNDTVTHKGEGFVNYTIKPLSTASTGDSIRAIAEIIFDQNPSILTPKIFNVIDAKPPTSSMNAVSGVLDSSLVRLTFGGSDDAGGSGIGNFDIYYSENNGGFQIYQSEVADTFLDFRGTFGSSYAFYSRGRDNTGNLEDNKSTGDISFEIAPDEFFKPIAANTNLCVGDTFRIRWNSSTFTNIDLEYSADTGQTYVTLASSVGVADTGYTWVVPITVPAGEHQYFIRARNSSNDNIIDSTETFVIKESPTVALGADTAFCDGTVFSISLDAGSGHSSYSWSTGSSGQSITATTFGTYTVTVSNAFGCEATDEVTIEKWMNPTIFNRGKSDPLCNGSTDGSAYVNVASGTAPYNYTWSNGQTNDTLSAVGAGTYTVSITDQNGCATADTFTLDDPDALSHFIASTQVSCFGFSDGAADLTVSGGTQPYSFSWSNGSTTEDISGLSANSYQVTITDDNGCTSRDSTTITQPDLLASGTSLTHVKCYGGNSGEVDLSVTGGTTPYSYSWSNGASSQDLSGLSSGTYTVLITDANSCTLRDTAEVTEPTQLASTGAVTSVDCKGNSTGSIDLSVTGGTGTYRYDWSNGSNQQDQSGLAAGTYTVIIYDANACEHRDTFVVTEPDELTVTLSPSDVSCKDGSDGSVNATVSGGTTPYSYSWSNSATTEDISNLSADTYILTVTDKKGCEVKDTAEVKEPTQLVSSVVSSDVSCHSGFDGSVNLTVTGGTATYSFVWSNSATTEDLSSLSAGTYTVLITDANGCTLRDTAEVDQPSPLAIQHTKTDVSCFDGSDGSVDLTVTGGTTPYQYSWSNSANTQDLSNLSSGTYRVLVTDANSCEIRDTATINQPTALQIAHQVTDVLCHGDLTGAVDVTVSGGTTPYTYAWEHGASSEDLASIASGTYRLLVTDGQNCEIRDTAVVTQPNAPLSSQISVDSVDCYETATGGIDLTVAGGTMPYQFLWNSGAQTEDLTGLIDGQYHVLVTDNNGCELRDTTAIYQPDSLIPTFNATDILCYGDNTGAISTTVSGGVPGYQYTWSNGAVTADQNGIPSGTYTLTLSDKKGCVTIDSVTLIQPAQPIASVLDSVVVNCFGGSDGSVDLTVTGGSAPYVFNWSNGETSEDLNNVPAGVYDVLITDDHNCTHRDTIEVTQPLAPLSSTVSIDDVKCFGGSDGSVDLNVLGGTVPYTFNWSNGSTLEDLTGLSAAVYTVTITDARNCELRDTADVGQPDAPLSSILDPTAVNCFGGSDGSVDLTVSGGTGPYQFNWNNGEVSEDINGLDEGEYSVLITDANLCTLRDTTVVTQPAAPLATSITTQDVSCFGGNDGMIDLTVTGGTTPYRFDWDNGGTSEDLSGLTVGKYRVTVTDTNGCIIADSATLFEPTDLVITTGSAPSVSDAPNGRVWVMADGGTPPYTILWNTGKSEDADTVHQVSIGVYVVQVTDDLGCVKTDTIEVERAPDREEISLWPNPTTGKVLITELASLGLYEPITIEVWDMQPQLQMSVQIVGMESYNLQLFESLQNGMYQIKLINSRGIEYRKIVLIR